MGIPHLITHLRPFAVAGDLTGRSVIIDGPSFAYRKNGTRLSNTAQHTTDSLLEIFHICLAAKSDARNPFEAAPSYSLLGKTAIQWLDALSARDVKM